jgi:two-component system, OmpR family, response regulator ChvI
MVVEFEIRCSAIGCIRGVGVLSVLFVGKRPTAVGSQMKGIPDQGAIRILFVQDDEDYREALGADLSEHGFVVHGFADATSLLDSFDSAVEADLIILDWKLPRTSGIDLLGQLRRQGVVVFLTGLASTVHETLAFDMGATDFIDKSRGVDVLVSRLKRIVEPYKPIADRQADKFIACGKLVLKPEISRAHCGRRPHHR